MTDSFEIIKKVNKKWSDIYTRELRKHVTNFHLQEEWEQSDDTAHYLLWGYIDRVCFYQGIIYAKAIWNYDMFENKCIDCPYKHICKYMRVVR